MGNSGLMPEFPTLGSRKFQDLDRARTRAGIEAIVECSLGHTPVFPAARVIALVVGFLPILVGLRHAGRVSLVESPHTVGLHAALGLLSGLIAAVEGIQGV